MMNLLSSHDVTLFVDGSAFIDRETGRKHAGFGIVSLDRSLLIEQPLHEHCSAQQAELLALDEVCKLGSGLKVNIYSDSAYANGVCLSWLWVWKGRDFVDASGTPIKNLLQIEALLEAMLLPAELAILKVLSHTGNTDSISLGNAAADAAAKNAASRCHTHAVLLASPCTSEITDLDQHQAAYALNYPLWESRGCSRGPDGLWRQSLSGKPALPLPLVSNVCRVAHPKGGEVKTNI